MKVSKKYHIRKKGIGKDRIRRNPTLKSLNQKSTWDDEDIYWHNTIQMRNKKVDLTNVPPEKLKLSIILKMKEGYINEFGDYEVDESEGGFGGDFEIQGVGSGYMNPQNGLVTKLKLKEKYNTKKNKEYIKGKVEELMFEFISREMDIIKGREFETDLRRLTIS